jgi:hypothetical protein
MNTNLIKADKERVDCEIKSPLKSRNLKKEGIH